METITLGRYRIVREIARGAMGIVFEAEDPQLGRRVALKVLKEGDADEKHVKRLHNEALAAAKLRHPNIITIHDVGIAGPVHYFAMDYIEGRGLDKILSERSTPLRELVHLLEDVARAVHFAHGHGVIHRDLKPANILVDRTGRAIVTDFGLAKNVDASGGLTRSGASVGTPHYMAPEQILAETARIGPRTDVFSLGVMLYQMLTGTLPYEGDTVVAVFQAILYQDLVPPSRRRAIDRDLEQVNLKALEKDPALRYPTAEAFADDLRRWLNREPVEARPPSTMRQVRARLKRHPAFLGAIVASLAILGIGVPVGIHQWQSRRREKHEADARDRLERDRSERRRDAIPLFETGRRELDRVEEHRSRQEILQALDKAAASFEAALAIHPEYVEAEVYLGRVHALRYLYDKKDVHFEEADRRFARAIQRVPNFADAHLYRGRLLLDRYAHLRGAPAVTVSSDRTYQFAWPPETEAAARCRERVLEELRNVQGADAIAAEGRLALYQANYELAIRRLVEASDLDKRNAETWHYLGTARLYHNDYESAVVAFGKAIEYRPRHAEALINRGLCLEKLNRLTKAIEDYDAARDILGDVPLILINRATCLSRQGKLDDAERDLTVVLESEPTNVSALLNRGQIRAKRGNLRGALQDYQNLTRAAPDYAPGFGNLGGVYTDLGQFDRAIECFDTALRLRPQHPDTYFNRGRAHAGAGDFDRAIADMTKVIELDPNDAAAWNTRGTYRESLFKKPEDRAYQDGALADYTKAIDLDRRHGPAYFNRGMLRMVRKEYREALADLKLACECSPELGADLEDKIRELEAHLNP